MAAKWGTRRELATMQVSRRLGFAKYIDLRVLCWLEACLSAAMCDGEAASSQQPPDGPAAGARVHGLARLPPSIACTGLDGYLYIVTVLDNKHARQPFRQDTTQPAAQQQQR